MISDNAQHTIDAIIGFAGEAVACDINLIPIVGKCCIGVIGILLCHVFMPMPDNLAVMIGVLL